MSESAIRLIAAVAALIIMSIGFAHAQTVTKVEVYEYGVYEATPFINEGLTREGIVYGRIDNIELVASTRTIMARRGTEFGFRFRILGTQAGAAVPMTIVMKFPQPGISAPDSAQRVLDDEYRYSDILDGDSFFIWVFDRDEKMVPGLWTFEIWIDGKKFAEQNFNIIVPPIANRQSPPLSTSGKVG